METWSQTQEVHEKEMSDEAIEEKEKELETREKKLEKKEKEVEAEKAKKKAEKAKKDEEKASKRSKRKERKEELKKLLEEEIEDSDESEASVEEADPTSPESGPKKEKKGGKKKKARKMNSSESSDEGCTRFTLQARTKVPTIEKGMTYAKYKTNVDMWKHAMKGCMSEKSMGMALLQSLPNEDNRGGIKEQAWKKLGEAELTCKDGVDNLLQFLKKKLLKTDFVRCIELNDKHTAIKHQEGWSIDKYIAEAQQIWEQIADMGYAVPAPMKCATLIRGLNLTETQVHLIASKLSVRATDLEEQTVDAIKAFTDTNRVLTKANKLRKTKEEESVNIAEDALGYKIGEEPDEVDEALVAGVYGACNFCNKKGHFKRDCPDYKEKLLKIKKFKEAKGEQWMSPRSYAAMKKAQREKKDQHREKGTTSTTPTFLTQATNGNIKTTQLFDKNRMDEGSEYDSYVVTATNKTDRKGKEHGGRATHGNHWQAGMTKV